MKTKTFLAVLFMLVAGLQTVWAQKMVVIMTDNQVVKFDVSDVKDVTFEEADEHEWVDLGLPSGTLWATCNVGANSPEEYGDHFAWGETQPKSEYNWSTYLLCNGTEKTLTKYCYLSNFGYNGFTDTLTELLPEDDAATANWGAGWQMPSSEQIQELLDNTTTEWTSLGGVDGGLFTASNGHSIFLPAAGNRKDASLDYTGDRGNYWSRSLCATNCTYAFRLFFNSDSANRYDSQRFYGRSVRPVRKQ